MSVPLFILAVFSFEQGLRQQWLVAKVKSQHPAHHPLELLQMHILDLSRF
jgi:hypothetical protein